MINLLRLIIKNASLMRKRELVTPIISRRDQLPTRRIVNVVMNGTDFTYVQVPVRSAARSPSTRRPRREMTGSVVEFGSV